MSPISWRWGQDGVTARWNVEQIMWKQKKGLNLSSFLFYLNISGCLGEWLYDHFCTWICYSRMVGASHNWNSLAPTTVIPSYIQRGANYFGMLIHCAKDVMKPQFSQCQSKHLYSEDSIWSRQGLSLGSLLHLMWFTTYCTHRNSLSTVICEAVDYNFKIRLSIESETNLLFSDKQDKVLSWKCPISDTSHQLRLCQSLMFVVMCFNMF